MRELVDWEGEFFSWPMLEVDGRGKWTMGISRERDSFRSEVGMERFEIEISKFFLFFKSDFF